MERKKEKSRGKWRREEKVDEKGREKSRNTLMTGMIIMIKILINE